MKIRLNSDMGVSLGVEEYLMPYITSCSVACGGHFGNFETVDNTIKKAISHGVKVGAQPSFPDLQGFGNRELSFPYDLLVRSLTEQLKLFLLVADFNNTKIDHVKPHGALYNLAMKNTFHVDAICEAMKNLGLTCPVYGNGYFFIDRAFAQNGIVIVKEVMADIQYRADGNPVQNMEVDSYITDSEVVWNQILGVSQKKKIGTQDGAIVTIDADTYCVHANNPNALEILQKITSRTIDM